MLSPSHPLDLSSASLNQLAVKSISDPSNAYARILLSLNQVAALPKGGAVEIEGVALVAANIEEEIIEQK